jgi:hypothetical protein
MLEGCCSKCGARYYGWALRNPRNQMCSRCGVALIITDEGGRIFAGYSPFTDDKNVIKKAPDLSSVDEKQDSPGKTGAA